METLAYLIYGRTRCGIDSMRRVSWLEFEILVVGNKKMINLAKMGEEQNR